MREQGTKAQQLADLLKEAEDRGLSQAESRDFAWNVLRKLGWNPLEWHKLLIQHYGMKE